MAEANDIPVVEPPGRDTTPNGLATGLSQLYQALLLTQKYDRQARGALVSVATITVPSPEATLGTNISNPPTEAEVQGIVTKLDAVIVKMNSILTILEFIKQTMDSNIETLN